jgi:ribosomal protein S18 acetylase RimI-like enzyme
MRLAGARMAHSTLTPSPIDIDAPAFEALRQWRFEDEFVARILADDIPQRTKYQNGRIWVYLDPEKNIVAFGTLSICHDYALLTDGKPHLYIPLLAVHPDQRGRGYGRSVVEHLVGEAACIVQADPAHFHSAVFLDVYDESVAAFNLYQKCGFATLGNPIVDPLNGKVYRIMAKRVSR